MGTKLSTNTGQNTRGHGLLKDINYPFYSIIAVGVGIAKDEICCTRKAN